MLMRLVDITYPRSSHNKTCYIILFIYSTEAVAPVGVGVMSESAASAYILVPILAVILCIGIVVICYVRKKRPVSHPSSSGDMNLPGGNKKKQQQNNNGGSQMTQVMNRDFIGGSVTAAAAAAANNRDDIAYRPVPIAPPNVTRHHEGFHYKLVPSPEQQQLYRDSSSEVSSHYQKVPLAGSSVNNGPYNNRSTPDSNCRHCAYTPSHHQLQHPHQHQQLPPPGHRQQQQNIESCRNFVHFTNGMSHPV
jgi:hypothetical protein